MSTIIAVPPSEMTGTANVASAALDDVAAKLKFARFPVFAVNADMAAAQQALDLAEMLGAGFTVAADGGVLAELETWRENGTYITSKREALARADTVLLVGSKAEKSAFATALRTIAPSMGGGERTVLTLDGASLKNGLALLSALSSPTPAPALSASSFDAVRDLANQLVAARFGVAVWAPAELDALEIAAVMALVEKLNRATRFTSLPLRDGSGNACGVVQLCLARWGVLPPARFVGGRAVELPRFSNGAVRSVDLIVTVSSFANLSMNIDTAVPTVAVGNPLSGTAPGITLGAGVLGQDYGGLAYNPEQDTYISLGDKAARQTSPAAILAALRTRLTSTIP